MRIRDNNLQKMTLTYLIKNVYQKLTILYKFTKKTYLQSCERAVFWENASGKIFQFIVIQST